MKDVMNMGGTTHRSRLGKIGAVAVTAVIGVAAWTATASAAPAAGTAKTAVVPGAQRRRAQQDYRVLDADLPQGAARPDRRGRAYPGAEPQRAPPRRRAAALRTGLGRGRGPMRVLAVQGPGLRPGFLGPGDGRSFGERRGLALAGEFLVVAPFL